MTPCRFLAPTMMERMIQPRPSQFAEGRNLLLLSGHAILKSQSFSRRRKDTSGRVSKSGHASLSAAPRSTAVSLVVRHRDMRRMNSDRQQWTSTTFPAVRASSGFCRRPRMDLVLRHRRPHCWPQVVPMTTTTTAFRSATVDLLRPTTTILTEFSMPAAAA